MAEFYNLFLNIVTKEKILTVSIGYEKLLNRFYIFPPFLCHCLADAFFFLMALRATGAQTEGFLFRYPLLTFIFLYQVAALLFSIINTQNGPSGCLLVIITKFSDQFPFKTR